MKSHCLNCKYWDKNEYILGGYDINLYGICEKASEYDDDGLFDANCIAEGIRGELVTRENFGCVAFEKK